MNEAVTISIRRSCSKFDRRRGAAIIRHMEETPNSPQDQRRPRIYTRLFQRAAELVVSIRSWVGRRTDPNETSPSLLALTPLYDSDQHGLYFAAIDEALRAKTSRKIRNIALTGSYGVGKSSILEQVITRHKRHSVSISLSTLGFADDVAPDDGVAKTASTKTNRIQKEIVKQLLYSQDPVRMPGSRYRRVTRFRSWRELGLALLIAAPLTIAFYLIGWSAALGVLARLPKDGLDWINIPLYFALAIFVMAGRKILHNRIHVDSISAGSTTIALSTKSATFFDEYLDEIVYFFERTRVSIVVFEDIDRFDEPHIFETLRSLNALLNGARQLRQRNIRFVYAIKDSIFDEIGARAAAEEIGAVEEKKARRTTAGVDEDAAQAEISRANRTKFFDLVIPVVPFVTHLSARNALKDLLNEVDGHKVSVALMTLAASHVADMRLIKNIRNEFVVFRNRVIVNNKLGLNDDGLLAMMLYKSTHLADFEKIKAGESDLDHLYDAYRTFINTAIAERQISLGTLRRRREGLRPVAPNADKFGDKLEAHIERFLRQTGGNDRAHSMTFDGEDIEFAALHERNFWESLAAKESSLDVTYQFVIPSWGNVFTRTASFTREDIAAVVGEALKTDRWLGAQRAALDQRIASTSEELEFLRGATLRKLVSRKAITAADVSFDAAVESTMKSKLARQLVRNGYIDSDFTRYTSIFHSGLLSGEATSFIEKHVDRNLPDLNYILTPGDVDAILRDRGKGLLGEKTGLNVCILDHLLAAPNDPRTVAYVENLTAYTADEKALVDPYLENGNRASELVQLFAKSWSGTLKLLASDAPLDEHRRLALIDVALRAIDSKMGYELPPSFSDLMLAHYQDMPVFQDADLSTEQAERLATVLDAVGLEVSSLPALGPQTSRAFVAHGHYALTRANLQFALGPDSDGFALDEIRDANDAVYARVLRDVHAYVAQLDPSELTIRTSTNFAALLGDIHRAAPDELRAVVERAETDLVVASIRTLPSEAWQTLADLKRFPLNYSNVRAYFSEFGIDAHLARLLADADEITDTPYTDEAETEKRTLALGIIEASTLIPNPAARAKLAASLHLKGFIPPDSIPQERGELVGRLIEEVIIQGSAESFTRLNPNDWPGLEYAISVSDFADFMSPIELPAALLGDFFASRKVSDEARDVVISRFDEFTADASVQTLHVVADWVVANGKRLPLAVVTRLASELDAMRIVGLLEPLLPQLDLSSLRSILAVVGGDYAAISTPTRKRPLFSATRGMLALAQRLRALGVVTKIDEANGGVRLSMKHR